ncbi:EamA family transporter RarD [Streptomyces sp. NBC_01186]|uniref:EamA family transporter RarD n=1 Tax=Streptomyces sp. NBC_01186 TaxID=2903765 RepID=UPI002E0F386A|nr:EamA family transporter RarD [Streptomyces sp. NBC_01186]
MPVDTSAPAITNAPAPASATARDRNGRSGPPRAPATGLAFGVTTYVLWGLFPLYWPLLEPASSLEILAHRMTWSLPVLLLVLVLRRDRGRLRRIVAMGRRAWLLILSGLVIAVNWGIYIWATTHGHVLEASLGYFINPIMTVLLGVTVLRERLRPHQWAALGLGFAAIVVIAAGAGTPPWVPLLLGATSALYGLLRKFAAAPATEALVVESATTFVPAVVYLAFAETAGRAVFGHTGVAHGLLLASAGLATVLPLMSFGAATTRLPLSVLGFLQYINPAMQFLIGLFVLHESVSGARWAGFSLIWGALLLFCVGGLWHRPARIHVRDGGVGATHR